MSRLLNPLGFPLWCGALVLCLSPAHAQACVTEEATRAHYFYRIRSTLLEQANQLTVSGASVGIPGKPGAFFQLVGQLADSGERTALLALIKSKNVVVRAAGMFALAKNHPQEALVAIKALRKSKAMVPLQIQGCSVLITTEGELVKAFLGNAHLLTPMKKPRSLRQVAKAKGRADTARAALVKEADQLTVSGEAVGRGRQPGRFFKLASRLAENGDKAALLALLNDEHVVVRAAGMFALAQKHPQDAVRELKAREGSQVKLRLQASGCGVQVVTEGTLATRFLRNANLLNSLQPPRPLGDTPKETKKR
ncbi:MAG: hypothetical protein JKY65_06640 [Planctomycetes bacterium]|nr:hypothetical protein [Planctomycetota bacterium]